MGNGRKPVPSAGFTERPRAKHARALVCFTALLPGVLLSGCSVAEQERGAEETTAVDPLPEFFFLLRNAPKVGGFPRTVETLYLHANGTALRTREDDDNVLYAVAEGRLETAAILQALAGAWPEETAGGGQEPNPNEPLVVSEYHEASTTVWLGEPGGGLRHWIGTPEELPAELPRIIATAEEQLGTPQAWAADRPRASLRAHLLSPESERESRRAGLLREAGAAALAGSQPLRDSLANPFMLISLEPDHNPFEMLGRTLEPGRTVVELIHEGRAFQLRVLRSADGP